jgi:hypothetical protein
MSLKNKNCCKGKAAVAGTTAAWGLRIRARGVFSELAEWLLPGVILAMLPKCPLCVMAYVAMATGIGLSFSTAATARILIIGVCITALSYFAAKCLYRLILTPGRRLL